MKTKIKTIHNEEITGITIKRTIGVILNYSIDQNDNNWHECIIYSFNHKTLNYTFYHTIIDLINSVYYGESKIKIAMLSENEFDKIYDSDYIDGKFSDLLEWV